MLTPAAAAPLMSFWDTPQHGGNSFNASPPDATYFRALKKTGATWVRLTFSKWQGAKRDFLIGNADKYTGLVKADLKVLKDVLDAAHQERMKVVLVPLSLPGARWTQQNGGKFDDRLWSDTQYWEQSAQFWQDLAAELKDHPAIAAYNILNEPAPEKTTGVTENGRLEEARGFIIENVGSARHLPGFYENVIKSIRRVDKETPIMVDSGYYANPRNLAAWPSKLMDDKVLYAFHMYEPYDATSAPNLKRQDPNRYPGTVTKYDGQWVTWDRELVRQHISMAFDWAKRNQVSANRIVAAEFGCMRQWQDCATYLEDVMDAVDAHVGHWAFYAFREDEWEGMDYELPTDLKAGHFYWRMDMGTADKLPRNGKLMKLISARMKAAQTAEE
ncbi:glycoside hydrolase family 5 protein [Pseudovibrio sp. SPO723]|uniref:glycoside hydrolase family 5 protein n=1 Tax=Nesiotobacter zosterae TaxID=392721 RepID=UPI0029C547AE|nr:cellulase family glycosylhydrolase [Pseudovibrio sp. SPO723]MDX5594427.1 cellulase family glycosylhydrolase [Pseudovibrio sp. SPO723]